MYYLRAFSPYGYFYETTLWDYFIGVVLMCGVIGLFTIIRYFFGGKSSENAFNQNDSKLVVSPFLIQEGKLGTVTFSQNYGIVTKTLAIILIGFMLLMPLGSILTQDLWMFW